MKKQINKTDTQNRRVDVNNPRPDNKDNLDSRERKEDGFKENDNKPEPKEKSKRP